MANEKHSLPNTNSGASAARKANSLKNPVAKRATQGRRAVADAAKAEERKLNSQASDLLALVLAVHKIVQRHNRPDSIAPLQAQLQYLVEAESRDEFTLAIVGAFTRGKSTFINALLRADVVPTSVLPTTAVYTRIGYGAEPVAELQFHRKKPQIVSLEEAHQYVATATKRIQGLQAIHVRYPSSLLQTGLVILDAPGIESVYPAHVEVAWRCVREADAVIFVFASDPILGQIECEFVRHAQTQVGKVFFVQTKIDLYENWTARLHSNAETLMEVAGIKDPKIHPISSPRIRAFQRTGDETDYKASGFDSLEQDLISFLQRDRVGTMAQKRLISARTAIAQVRPELERQAQAAQELIAQHKTQLAGQKKLFENSSAEAQVALDESRACLRQYQQKAKEIVQAAGDRAEAAYDKYVASATVEDLLANAESQLRNVLQQATRQLQRSLNRDLTKAAQEMDRMVQARLDAPKNLRLSGHFAFEVPSDVALQAKAVQARKSSSGMSWGAIVGGTLGSAFGLGVGTAIGAAIGAAIGGALQGKPDMDIEATRKGFAAEGQKVIRQHIFDLDKVLDQQLAGWVKESDTRICQHIEQVNALALRELSDKIAALEQATSQAARQAKHIQTELRQLGNIELRLASH